MVIYFDEKAATGFDKYYDALKLMNTDFFVPNLYSFGSDGSKLSINALPPESPDTLRQIPLGLKLNIDGNIIFRIRDLGEELLGNKIFISDMASGTERDLLGNGEYKVFLKAGEYTNRFFLNLSAAATGIPDTHPYDMFTIYASHGIIKMKIGLMSQKFNLLTISNLMGQLLVIKKDLESGYHEFNPGLKDGIYIVTFASGNFRTSKKILIQNR
jgi:hypothetical protein